MLTTRSLPFAFLGAAPAAQTCVVGARVVAASDSDCYSPMLSAKPFDADSAVVVRSAATACA
jgi:hypothetical protein